MPLITRRPKIVQLTAKVTARPFLAKECSEARLGFGARRRVDIEEAEADVDDEDGVEIYAQLQLKQKVSTFIRKLRQLNKNEH